MGFVHKVRPLVGHEVIPSNHALIKSEDKFLNAVKLIPNIALALDKENDLVDFVELVKNHGVGQLLPRF